MALLCAARPGVFQSARARFETRFLAAKLQEYSGNITRLAEAIGLERSYLHRKLKSARLLVRSA